MLARDPLPPEMLCESTYCGCNVNSHRPARGPDCAAAPMAYVASSIETAKRKNVLISCLLCGKNGATSSSHGPYAAGPLALRIEDASCFAAFALCARPRTTQGRSR